MSPPPTSIDGTQITGATIDGQDIDEITVDGQTVFTAAPPLQIIHQYDFEDNTTPSTLTDNVGSADGSISGMTYTSSQADGNFAGDFDSNDIVSIPAAETPPISYTFDLFPRSSGQGGTIIFEWGFDFGANQGYQLKIDGGGDLDLLVGNDFGNDTQAFSFDQRQHIGITVSANDEIKMYIDGSQVLNFTDSTSGFTNSSALGGGSNTQMILDDFEVFGKELSQAEVNSRI